MKFKLLTARSVLAVAIAFHSLPMNAKVRPQRAEDSVTALVLLNKATADNESYLNLLGVLFNQKSQVEKIKKTLKPAQLKAKPDFKRLDDSTFIVDGRKIGFTKSQVSIDGVFYTFEGSRDLFQNYQKMRKILSSAPSKKKVSKFDLLLPASFADPGEAIDVGGTATGIVFLGMGLKAAAAVKGPLILNAISAFGAALSGLGLIFASSDVHAEPGMVPMLYCESRERGFRNAIKTNHGTIQNQDFVMNEKGELVFTTRDGEVVRSQVTIAKQGDDYEVVKMVQDGEERSVSGIPKGEGDRLFQLYSDCRNPQVREQGVQTVQKIQEKIKSGEIRLASAAGNNRAPTNELGGQQAM